MSSDLSRRIEQRFLEIEMRMRGNMPTTQTSTNAGSPASYVDDQIEKYEYYLIQAMNNLNDAAPHAPCQGCKRTVQASRITVLSALTGLAIYRKMSESGRNRADFTDQEIEHIKKEVENRYGEKRY